jgi:hypothetical protein
MVQYNIIKSSMQVVKVIKNWFSLLDLVAKAKDTVANASVDIRHSNLDIQCAIQCARQAWYM